VCFAEVIEGDLATMAKELEERRGMEAEGDA